MLSRVLLALAFALVAWSPSAMADQPATQREISGETLYAQLDGPGPGEKRAVYVWRPSNASGRLPVVYMADGLSGLSVVVQRLRPAILSGRMAPIMVVGIDSGGQHRRMEYLAPLGDAPSPLFDAYQDWLFNIVMPWAEGAAGASSDPRQRIVGGYSNGADFALVTAERHPAAFAGVLAYSPVYERPLQLDRRAANLRWVITGGQLEWNGEIVELGGKIARDIAAQGGAVRRCVGPWGHRLTAWRDLSPGTVAWLFNLPEADAVASPAERAHCR